MIYLFAILISIVLFSGFVGLTAFEGARGVRVFARTRDRLDARTARVSFIIQHVDWSAFIGHAVRTLLEHAAHEVVHATLIAVRALERLLTRAVRTLRSRNSERIPEVPTVRVRSAPARLRGTVEYLRTTLRTTRRKPKVIVPSEEV